MRSRNAAQLAAVALLVGLLAACAPLSAESPAADSSAAASSPRPRPEVPTDWPPGKRIVMHVTPSLKESYLVACDLPVPALTYMQGGHQVIIAVDRHAITAFRRDAAGKTPLDQTEILAEDLDDLPSFLAVARPDVPKNFGDLYRILASKGAVIVADVGAVRAQGIDPAELDPVVKVVSSDEFQHIITDNDTLLPYDEIGMPHHSIFGEGHH